MTNLQDSEITFPIAGGIFGVGQLATSLKALTEAGKIGPWHIGRWIDFRHTAIHTIRHQRRRGARQELY
jgi:hypothetical protein